MKDILNYRYFHKRALYLSIIAGHLKKKKKTLSLKSIKFESFGGNPLLPILVLVPEGKQITIIHFSNISLIVGKPLSKYTIRLHTLVPDPAFFKLSKLGPDRNNVRRNFLSSSPIQSDDEFECDPPPPTPHYNTSLLMELGARERDLKELFSSCQDSPGFADAVVLYKVWARQRNLDKVSRVSYRRYLSLRWSFILIGLWWIYWLPFLHVGICSDLTEEDQPSHELLSNFPCGTPTNLLW